ncbi:MAG: hypothetical protein R2844_15480 [Caldilineales bacterium]
MSELTSTDTPEPVDSEVSVQAASIASEALTELARIVEGFVVDGKVVGAELAVIKDRQVLLHEVFGY